MMRLEEVLGAIEELSPLRLAEAWDKVGLQIGDRGMAVRRGMLCIDLTEEVLAEAIRERAELAIAYHPVIFSPLSALTADHVRERIVMRAVRAGVAVFSPHTALDAVEGGINDWLCDGIGRGWRRPIKGSGQGGVGRFKVVTFVPVARVDAVREAMAGAGAGRIGDYSECSFGLMGRGTFRGGATTNPRVGKRGRFERVAEVRLEMVCSAGVVGKVVVAMRGAHPYEEPAFDVYPLVEVEGDGGKGASKVGEGQGRVLTLDRAIRLEELVRRVKRHLGVKQVEVAAGKGKVGRGGKKKLIRSVGVCAGAGGSLVEQAGEVDAFVTGEMRHHDVLAGAARGVAVVLAGHTQTERPYLKTYRKRIVERMGGGMEWLISEADREPGERM